MGQPQPHPYTFWVCRPAPTHPINIPRGPGDHHNWETCPLCQGTVSHPPLRCPFRNCIRCHRDGHDKSECLENIWDIPAPTNKTYVCPFPLRPVGGGQPRFPRWAQLEVSPRVMCHLYRVPLTSSIGLYTAGGRPNKFWMHYEGVHFNIELQMEAKLEQDKMMLMRFRTSYPGSCTKQTTHLKLLVSGIIYLLNALHALETLPLQPWSQDINTTWSQNLVRTSFAWPSGSRLWDINHLSLSVEVEREHGDTDRMLHIRLMHESKIFQAEVSSFVIPWLMLPAFRMRFANLADEWRLFTGQEEEVMGYIRQVLHRS